MCYRVIDFSWPHNTPLPRCHTSLPTCPKVIPIKYYLCIDFPILYSCRWAYCGRVTCCRLLCISNAPRQVQILRHLFKLFSYFWRVGASWGEQYFWRLFFLAINSDAFPGHVPHAICGSGSGNSEILWQGVPWQGVFFGILIKPHLL